MEIKHILPYLEHNLTVVVKDFNGDDSKDIIDEVIGVERFGICGRFWSVILKSGIKCDPKRIVPILRSLGEVTSEISDILSDKGKMEIIYYRNLRSRTFDSSSKDNEIMISNHFNIFGIDCIELKKKDDR